MDQAIIRAYNVVVGEIEERGRDLFQGIPFPRFLCLFRSHFSVLACFAAWTEDLGDLGDLYGEKLIRCGYGDLIKICRSPSHSLSLMLCVFTL